MRGSFFRSIVESGELTLPPGVQVDDLETMYTLLLAARGIGAGQTLSKDEEMLALGALCRYNWPLKPDDYGGMGGRDVATLLSHFRGISNSVKLQAKFKARISPRFASGTIAELESSEGLRNIYQVVRKVRGEAMRRQARAFRAELEIAAQAEAV